MHYRMLLKQLFFRTWHCARATNQFAHCSLVANQVGSTQWFRKVFTWMAMSVLMLWSTAPKSTYLQCWNSSVEWSALRVPNLFMLSQISGQGNNASNHIIMMNVVFMQMTISKVLGRLRLWTQSLDDMNIMTDLELQTSSRRAGVVQKRKGMHYPCFRFCQWRGWPTCLTWSWSSNSQRCTLKWPTLTKSTSSSSSDNGSGLVAPRDNGKSPRGQDWGPPGALLRLYMYTIQGFGYVYTRLYDMLCYMTRPWVVHEDNRHISTAM